MNNCNDCIGCYACTVSTLDHQFRVETLEEVLSRNYHALVSAKAPDRVPFYMTEDAGKALEIKQEMQDLCESNPDIMSCLYHPLPKFHTITAITPSRVDKFTETQLQILEYLRGIVKTTPGWTYTEYDPNETLKSIPKTNHKDQ